MENCNQECPTDCQEHTHILSVHQAAFDNPEFWRRLLISVSEEHDTKSEGFGFD